jgi:hypothetical protein
MVFMTNTLKVALWFFSGGAPIAPIKEYLGDRGFKPVGGGRGFFMDPPSFYNPCTGVQRQHAHVRAR